MLILMVTHFKQSSEPHDAPMPVLWLWHLSISRTDGHMLDDIFLLSRCLLFPPALHIYSFVAMFVLGLFKANYASSIDERMKREQWSLRFHVYIFNMKRSMEDILSFPDKRQNMWLVGDSSMKLTKAFLHQTHHYCTVKVTVCMRTCSLETLLCSEDFS